MTIVIDDEELERRIAEVAAARNQTVLDYVIEALRAFLIRHSRENLAAIKRHQRKQAALARIRSGAYADLPTSSDEFAAQKAEEIEREERRLRPL